MIETVWAAVLKLVVTNLANLSQMGLRFGKHVSVKELGCLWTFGQSNLCCQQDSVYLLVQVLSLKEIITVALRTDCDVI